MLVTWPGWLTVAQLLIALATVAALLFTAQSLRATQSQIGLTEQGQLTERFGKAIEQLGSDKADIRLGGIYALERLAADSARDHPTVMEVLTAYVRRSAPSTACTSSTNNARPLLDLTVQAAVSVIGRRNASFDTHRLDLTRTCLEYVQLGLADLGNVNFSNADLTGANLNGADLTGAFVPGANLTGADLGNADLGGAFFAAANLTGANLGNADLGGANFAAANLTGADLGNADLTDAIFLGANLTDVRRRTN